MPRNRPARKSRAPPSGSRVRRCRSRTSQRAPRLPKRRPSRSPQRGQGRSPKWRGMRLKRIRSWPARRSGCLRPTVRRESP
ncbi:MAG: hypothetical protein EHM17_12800 [Verrucomicrobiaceae bacterium]|nr:MAG: hypothetical protein EHM17_12800 [Verrucomicrobiaceae bacterium]